MTLDQGFTIAHFLSSALVWPNRNHTSFLPTGSRTLVCPKSEPALKCRTSPLNSSCWESADYSQKHFPSEFLSCYLLIPSFAQFLFKSFASLNYPSLYKKSLLLFLFYSFKNTLLRYDRHLFDFWDTCWCQDQNVLLLAIDLSKSRLVFIWCPKDSKWALLIKKQPSSIWV